MRATLVLRAFEHRFSEMGKCLMWCVSLWPHHVCVLSRRVCGWCSSVPRLNDAPTQMKSRDSVPVDPTRACVQMPSPDTSTRTRCHTHPCYRIISINVVWLVVRVSLVLFVVARLRGWISSATWTLPTTHLTVSRNECVCRSSVRTHMHPTHTRECAARPSCTPAHPLLPSTPRSQTREITRRT